MTIFFCLFISLLYASVSHYTCDAFSPFKFTSKCCTKSPLPVLSSDYDVDVDVGVDVDIEGSSNASPISTENSQNSPESASLLPGQVVSIRIGDTNLARKAWKKRRRSGSPILVPCTIIGMNRESMVKNNLINLLHRFGKSNMSNNNKTGKNSSKSNNNNINNKKNPNGVHLTVGAIVKLYKHRLGGDLLQHAKALGHKTIVAYLKATFDENCAKEHGVQMIRIGSRNELALSSSLTMRLAREAAYRAEFVQFVASGNDSGEEMSEDHDLDHAEDDGGEDDDFFPELSVDYDELDVDEDDEIGINKAIIYQMVHSGTTFQFDNDQDKYQSIADMDSSTIQPLSAAVRIAQAEEITTRITSGMECNAFVHSYEAEGDNGSPLLICAIDPPREQIRDQLKRRAYVRKKMNRVDTDIKLMKRLDGNESSVCDLKDLNAGDGPFQATVVRVSERSGAAFVDLGVSRQKGKKHGGGKARVLGMLRFEDVYQDSSSSSVMSDDVHLGSSECTNEEAAIIEASILEGSSEEDEVEYEEDVSDMYFIDKDGQVSMLDPETQNPKVIGSIDDDASYDDEDDDDDNMFAGMSPEERLHAIGEMLAKQEEVEVEEEAVEAKSNINRMQEKASLEVGDEVNVYVRAVFPQSGRFMVTTDKSVKKLKDLKQQKEADKRIERLASKMGGESGIQMIQDLEGEVMEGEVKAASKAGDWYYVQPLSETKLPVGVAGCEIHDSLSSGDKVEIRINGIDHTKGQLSLTIINRL